MWKQMNPKAITCFSAISCLETIIGLSIEPAKETFLLSPCLYGPMFPEGVGSSCGNEVHVKEFDVPPVDAEGFIEFRSLWYFGIPVSLQPSVELDVAHCSEFLLGRDQAEPESAQFRRVWSMDRTICPSRRVVYFATLQQIFLNADCPSIKRMIRVRNRTTQVRFPLKNRRFPLTSTFLKAALVLNTPSVFSSSMEWEARVCIRRSIPVRALISAIVVFGSSCGQGLRFRLWWFCSARIAERAR